MNTGIAITLHINGEARQCTVAPDEKLLDTLRSLDCKSVKFGCGEGTCGSCMVLVDGAPRLACLTYAAQMDGAEITTVEGLGDGDDVHPIQQAFLEEGAVQCGYCTPAMILATKALLDRTPSPSDEDIRIALDGNRCRCTGYVNILNAVKTAAGKMTK